MRPNRNELRRCPVCEEPVLWTVTRTGRRMAVDPRPDEKGNQACHRGSLGAWQSRSLTAADAQPVQAYEYQCMPHVATCKPKTREAPAAPLPPNVIRLDPAKRRSRSR